MLKSNAWKNKGINVDLVLYLAANLSDIVYSIHSRILQIILILYK